MAEPRRKRFRRVKHPTKPKKSKSEIKIDLRKIGDEVETDITFISKETAL